jgi:bacteriocin-like protein
MSKTTAINTAATSGRELTEDELSLVSGGIFTVREHLRRIFSKA